MMPLIRNELTITLVMMFRLMVRMMVLLFLGEGLIKGLVNSAS
jgi:hypothetical protein